jgi:hypothetical protein
MIKIVNLDPLICAIFGTCTSPVVVTVSQSAPAHPGDTVHILGTGFGVTDPSGAKLVNAVTVSVGGQNATGVDAHPFDVGQDYVAFTVPAVPTSGNVPVIVTSGAVASPPVLLPISVLQSTIKSVSNSTTGPDSAIESGSWVSIYGTDLSVTTRSWQISDFSGNALPLSLDGVSVTINGRPAAVSYISPGQVNVQAPDDSTTGPVDLDHRHNDPAELCSGFLHLSGKVCCGSACRRGVRCTRRVPWQLHRVAPSETRRSAHALRHRFRPNYAIGSCWAGLFRGGAAGGRHPVAY